MSRIFLSHSSTDNGPAVALHNWLKAEGWDDVFLDLDPERGILAGERWERALNEAAYRCEAVLFLVSRAWLGSSWCRKEFHLAAKLNKRMFGILIEDVAMSDLPAELTQTWQLVNLAQGADHQPFRATLADGREEHATFSRGGLQQLKSGLSKAGLDPRFFAWPPADDPERPPYRGLLSMEAEDAGIFFGREAPVIETLDRLRGLREGAAPRLLVILGASGAGKSSFLRAGIIPRLMRDDRNFLVLPVIRPERAVLTGEAGLLRSLEAATKALDLKLARAEIKKRLAAGASEVLSLLVALAEQATPPKLGHEVETKRPSLVIAIDQGEELFQAEGGEEVRSFLALLKDLATAAEPNLIILFTIRSDAYAALQSEPMLKDIHQQPLNLPPVPRGAYQTIIEGPPARLRNTKRALNVDPKLTAALLEDVEAGGAKDALPLLAFTLERLYVEHGGDGDLRLDEYRELGGITGSIEAAVEQALSAADADPAVPKDRAARLALLRRAFIPWLAGIDPDTGSPRRSIARLGDVPEEARPLIRYLIEQRLLATDRDRNGETTIEPAHEALLRQWGLLKGWLEEDFAQLASLEAVKRATRDWLANNRSPDWLAHSAGRLEDAERLEERSDLAAKLAADDVNYLAQCRTAETERKDRELRQAKKLTRAIAAGLIAAVLLAAIAGGFGYYAEKQAEVAVQKSEEAERASQRATYNESVALSGLSRVALSDGYPPQATKLALAAWPRAGDNGRPALKRIMQSLGVALPQNLQRLVLRGHEGPVNSADYSPDGTRLVTASGDSTARLWDAKSGAEIAVLKGHEGSVVSAAFSPDGGSLVTASWDGTARLWDAKSGAGIAVLRGHEGYVWSAAFSPGGKQVVTASSDKTARLWDARTGQMVAVLKGHEQEVTSAAFSPDETRIVTASTDGTARLWDVRTGVMLAVLEGHKSAVKSATFSPDGTRVATASPDNTARLWDAKTGLEIAVLNAHEERVVSAVFSPDGTRVVTASYDNTARLWDATTGIEITVLKGHEGYVETARFSRDGSRVVTASWDDTARLWDAKSGIEIATLKGHGRNVNAVAFSPDGSRVVTASSDQTARLWDVKSGIDAAILRGHENRVWSVAFSPDRTRVLTASSDRTARLWDVESGIETVALKGGEKKLNAAAFSPDGTRVATASDDGTARLWDARTGAETVVLSGHGDRVWSAVFSPDGTKLVTTSADKTARLWDLATATETATLRGHKARVDFADFSPDGTRVVTASADDTARLWDAKTGSEMAVLTGHEGSVLSAVFSPDGLRLVTTSDDMTARLWDGRTGREMAVLHGHQGSVISAAFSPDGAILVTASADKTARLWDATTGKLIMPLDGHQGIVFSARFSPDGKRIATASGDGTARLWDMQTGIEIARLKGHAGYINSAVFSPDGRRVATASEDGTARLWDVSDLETGDGLAIACERLGNDTDLTDVRERYGLGEMVPICGKNAPLPVDLEKLQ